MSKIIYDAEGNLRDSILINLSTLVHNTWNSRFLITQLLLRDIFSQYKKSYLGALLILVSPLSHVLVWIFLEKFGILSPGKLQVSYPAYIMVGIMSWDFFIGIFHASSKALKSGSGLSSNVNFPREIFFVKEVVQFLFNFSLRFLLVMGALLIIGVIPHWQLVFFPLVCLPALLLSSGLGLITSLFMIISEDVLVFTGFSFRLLMWSAPIIYVSNPNNELMHWVNSLNPLTSVVCSMRDIILYGKLYEERTFFLVSIFSIITFSMGLRMFYASERRLLSRMQ